MAGAFTAVDLSRLPFPAVVETIDFEVALAAMLADLRQRDPAFTALVESDPAYKVLEACAYRELLLRQRVNEAAKAVLLAYSAGADLDQIAANFNVQRLVLVPANPNTIPPTPAVLEPDDDLRRRVQLAFEGLSTAGPEGAYVFHALGAHPDVLDASATSPTPGVVTVSVLSRVGNGAPAAPVLAAVAATLADDDVRPLTDQVSVVAAEIVDFTVAASLTLYPGPDSAVVLAEANARLTDYLARSRRLGRDVTRSGVFAALHGEGVQNVVLTQPAADVVVTPTQAAFCTARTVTVAGTGV
ncbi:MAG: baseplate J/gp47 family protein [Xanthomonadaceae bacterium]|nr:baseplate J/gp47 family protein [Xanthomonadaceae bacterium]